MTAENQTEIAEPATETPAATEPKTATTTRKRNTAKAVVVPEPQPEPEKTVSKKQAAEALAEQGFENGPVEVPAQPANDLELKITNTGVASFEIYTRTPLPSGQTVTLVCPSLSIKKAIVNKLNQLNILVGHNRYIIEE